MKNSWDDEKIDQMRMIGEDLIRQGERILGMCEGHKVKKEDVDEEDSGDEGGPSKKKVNVMLAFMKKKK